MDRPVKKGRRPRFRLTAEIVGGLVIGVLVPGERCSA
jgi:hypothetical protein